MLQPIIRKTREEELFLTENLTREAFWDVFKPGCDEHLVLHQVRSSPDYLPNLDLVAEVDGQILGHIVYTRSWVIDPQGRRHDLLSFGPLCVLPAYQRQGIGSALVRESIRRSRPLGYPGIAIYGHPAYYPRFGFENAARYGITTPKGENYDAFMVLPLGMGSLSGIRGKLYETDAFHTTPEALAAFEQRFPPKASHFVPKTPE